MGSIIKANKLKYLNCNKYYKKIGLDFKRDFYEKFKSETLKKAKLAKKR